MPAAGATKPASRGGDNTTQAGNTTRLDAIIAEANRLDKVHAPYTNARPPSDARGYDCSSSICDLLIHAGYKQFKSYPCTGPMRDMLKPGPDPHGKFTIWNNDRAKSCGNSVHTFCTIEGHDWGTSFAHVGGGPGYTASHTRDGFDPFHIDGLDQPASIPADANTAVGGAADGSNVPGGSAAGGATASLAEMYSVSKAAAFATSLNWPSIEQTIESIALQGQKSLMDDKPLIGFVQQLAQATMRSFQSAPNGDFYAFFPDYFGEFNHRQPYWEIEDIEIIEASLRLSDAPLVTHQYIVGDVLPQSFEVPGSVSLPDKIFTAGVMDIFQFFGANMLKKDDKKSGGSKTGGNPFVVTRDNENLPGLHNADDVLNFLQRYGVRPNEQDMPFVRSPFYEAFLALQQFMLAWSNQFVTTFTFTFMPELYPGGQVGFPSHGIQMYIDEVNHSFDYEAGFTTDAVLKAPAAYKPSDGRSYDDRASWGMVNALVNPVLSDGNDAP